MNREKEKDRLQHNKDFKLEYLTWTENQYGSKSQNNTSKQMYLADTYAKIHSTTELYTTFVSTNKLFSRSNHILGKI